MRVLLVEDDNMIGEALAAGLKDARYAADWVKNGRTALDALAAQAYDLVLLDLGLPCWPKSATAASLCRC